MRVAIAFVFLLAAAAGASAQTVDLRTYWPQPAAGLQVMNQDWAYPASPASPFRSVLRRYVARGTVRGSNVIRLDEYSRTCGSCAPVWLDAWLYRDDGSQILEVATAEGAVLKVYEVGKEIQWGGVMTLGDVQLRTVHVDPAASTGVAAGFWNWGTQRIEFAAFYSSYTTAAGLTFSNVVKLKNFQSWCANAGCAYPSGQTIFAQDYYLAPSVGIVQIDYLTPTARTDAALLTSETWETP